MDDALELLGPGFEDGRVRAFAVKQLARADDEVCSVYKLVHNSANTSCA
jgi:phosphatidylinositol 3-kinase